jgi:hypothetical protein
MKGPTGLRRSDDGEWGPSFIASIADRADLHMLSFALNSSLAE